MARQTRIFSSFEQIEISFANLFRAKASCPRRSHCPSEDSLTTQATTIGGGGGRGDSFIWKKLACLCLTSLGHIEMYIFI